MSVPLLGHGPRSDLETETFALAVGTLVGHTDRGGWRVGSDEAAAGHVVATPYRKAQKAHDRADSERWEEAEVAATLDAGNNTKTAHAIAVDMQNAGTGETLDVGYARTTDSAGSNGAGPRNVVLGTQGLSVRRLTPIECERLQGFPDGWTEGGAPPPSSSEASFALRVADISLLSDSARYRTLGNAVCVPVVEWIARRLGAMESLR